MVESTALRQPRQRLEEAEYSRTPPRVAVFLIPHGFFCLKAAQVERKMRPSLELEFSEYPLFPRRNPGGPHVLDITSCGLEEVGGSGKTRNDNVVRASGTRIPRDEKTEGPEKHP